MENFETTKAEQARGSEYLRAREKLEEILSRNMADESLTRKIVDKIISVGDQYELNLGEMAELYDLVGKAITDNAGEDEILEKLLKSLGVTETEIEEITVLLSEIGEQIKETSELFRKLNLAKSRIG